MVSLSFTPDEAETLIEVLRSYLSDLRMEIANTDSMDFRERLKETEAFLKRTITALGGEF